MGLDRTIRFSTAEVPSWEAICTQLRRVGEESQLRMIDGLPAFPDETPAPDWKELRLGSTSGMVTIRRGAGELTCMVWGNADPSLMSTLSKVCWACAAAGGGQIVTSSGLVSAEEFARSAGIQVE
jgi:hypothetical protein